MTSESFDEIERGTLPLYDVPTLWSRLRFARGTPLSVAAAAWLAAASMSPDLRWLSADISHNPDCVWHLRADDADIAVPVRGTLRVNDDEVAWQAVRAGLGVSLLPTFIVGDDLKSGRLQAALTQYLPSERTLYALYLPNRHLSAKVRVFIDFLLAKFTPPPYWDRDWQSPAATRQRRHDEPDAKRRGRLRAPAPRGSRIEPLMPSACPPVAARGGVATRRRR